MFLAGILTAIGIIILMLKLNRRWLKRLLGYDIVFDIAVTALMAVIFYGTYSGMMAATVGGIVFSVAVHTIKMIIGSEYAVLQGRQLIWIEAK